MQPFRCVKLLAVVVVVAGCASTPRATCGEGWASLSRERGVPPVGLARREFRYVEHVHIAGVDAHLASGMRAELETKVGMELSVAPLAADIRRLWKLGVIEDARVAVDEGDVTFVLTPRRLVTSVVQKGGDELAQSRFRRLAAAPFEPSRIRRMAEALQESYIREGRLDAQVEARQRVHATGVDICVATNPGPRITIAKLEFPGAKAVSEQALRKILHGKEANVNRPGGAFDEAALAYDEIFLQLEYWERGYAQISIGKPKVTRHGKRLHVAIPVTEGPLYRIGTVTAPVPVTLRRGEVFRRSRVVKVMEELQKHSVTNVLPQTHIDQEARIIDITYEVEWRYPWDALRFWLSALR